MIIIIIVIITTRNIRIRSARRPPRSPSTLRFRTSTGLPGGYPSARSAFSHRQSLVSHIAFQNNMHFRQAAIQAHPHTPIPSVLEKTLPKLTQKKLAAPEPLREKSAAQPESAQACLTGLQRRLTEDEYEALIDFAIENGIENGFIQDQETAQESFIPAFDGEGI